jgi:hypothetical protein
VKDFGVLLGETIEIFAFTSWTLVVHHPQLMLKRLNRFNFLSFVCGGGNPMNAQTCRINSSVMKIGTYRSRGLHIGTLGQQSGRLHLMASQPNPTGKPGLGGRGIARMPGTYEILCRGDISGAHSL